MSDFGLKSQGSQSDEEGEPKSMLSSEVLFFDFFEFVCDITLLKKIERYSGGMEDIRLKISENFQLIVKVYQISRKFELWVYSWSTNNFAGEGGHGWNLYNTKFFNRCTEKHESSF